MLKGMTKHKDKEHGKNLRHEAPRSINHKAAQNKKNSLERSVPGDLKAFLTVDKLHPVSDVDINILIQKYIKSLVRIMAP